VWVALVFLLALAAGVAAVLVVRDDHSNSRNPGTSTQSTGRPVDRTDSSGTGAQFA
jgi:hypothetical protein